EGGRVDAAARFIFRTFAPSHHGSCDDGLRVRRCIRVFALAVPRAALPISGVSQSGENIDEPAKGAAMRKFIQGLSVGGLLFATAAQAVTWQIGPSVGVDVFRQHESTVGVVAAPLGADVLTGGLRPGIRVGAWDAGMRHEFFLDTSALLLSGNDVLWTTSNTLNYAYGFDPGGGFYVTGGGGLAVFSSSVSETETVKIYGVGLGARHRLKHGHGSVRFEARLDGADGSREF